jgi:hypothetical protein
MNKTISQVMFASVGEADKEIHPIQGTTYIAIKEIHFNWRLGYDYSKYHYTSIINWRSLFSIWISHDRVSREDYRIPCRWVFYQSCTGILMRDQRDIIILGFCWLSGKRYILLCYMRRVILSSVDWIVHLERPFQSMEILF